MEQDEEFKAAAENLKREGQAALTRREAAIRRRALDGLGVPSFDEYLEQKGVERLERRPATTLQVNVGLYCNQACSHCHVESSPLRVAEQMDAKGVARLVELLDASPSVRTLDLTGGAPELNPHFRDLVRAGRERGLEVIDRCNLTVLYEEGQDDLADFLAENRARVVASMPCYSEANVDAQRGRGVFEKSIQALRDLNALGYGSELPLDLMYNPGGGFLPPAAAKLEDAYRAELRDNFGVVFSSLLTLTNMPIKRFADYLVQKGELESYMQLLLDNFNSAAVPGVMCKETVSVNWEGKLYDCDFNQQLALGMAGAPTIWDISSLDDVTGRKIGTDNHCFGCTAGAGSSCGGATA